MFNLLRTIRAKFAELPRIDRFGLALGIIGLTLCDLGLLLAILHTINGGSALSGAPETLLGRPFGAGAEMLLYLVGAAFLAVSAFLGGRQARLLQIQECALVLSGITFFAVTDTFTLFIIRVVMFVAMFLVVKFVFRLVRGPLSITGFAGTECLNWGYLFNSSLGFGLGGLLLAAYNWVQFKRTGSWVNALFLVLNMPFAIFAFVLYMAQCMRDVGVVATVEIFSGFVLFALVSLVTFLGVRFRRFPLDGVPDERRLLAADLQLSMFMPRERKMPFYEVADGHIVSFRSVRLLELYFSRLMHLRAERLDRLLEPDEEAEYERLSELVAEAARFVLDLKDHHQVRADGIPDDLLLESPDGRFERRDIALVV